MLYLPDDKQALLHVLEQFRSEGEQAIIPNKVQWMINYHWLCGSRNLEPRYKTGQVTASYFSVDEGGKPSFRYEELVPRINAEVGRFGRMDVAPAVSRRGHGLDALRRSATGQIILDHLTSPIDLNKLKQEMALLLALYGTVGITTWVQKENQPQLEQDEDFLAEAESSPLGVPQIAFSIIPPWELYPLPTMPTVFSEVEGIRRARWVTLDWLKVRPNLKLPQDKSKLKLVEKAIGHSPYKGFGHDWGVAGHTETGIKPDTKNSRSAKNQVAQHGLLEEFFIFEENPQFLHRWIVKMGDQILRDETYEARSMYVPIAVARRFLTGGFYGRSLAELLQPLNQQQEIMAASLFQNIADLDSYGMLLLPATWGLSKKAITNRTKRNKVEFYDPDAASEHVRPHQIEPVNTGDFPGKVLATAGEMMESLSQQSPLFSGQAPGRVDSASGLSFLHETGSIPLAVPASSIADSFVQMYRVVLAAAPDLLKEQSALPLLGFDDNLMGLQIDSQSGKVTLRTSNFPAPTQVKLKIRDEMPLPRGLREQKLKESLQMQIITPTMFRFIVWKENLDLPVGNWTELENFRKATLNCLFLFGDGEEPAIIPSSSMADNPEIHLMVLDAFMAKAEFQYASERVRTAFEELKNLLQDRLGTYPEGMPAPEMLPELNQEQIPTP